jgi:hypothetical protein
MLSIPILSLVIRFWMLSLVSSQADYADQRKPSGAADNGFLLVAFVGQQRIWESTWKSQSEYLRKEYSNHKGISNWGSVGCIDANDIGLSSKAQQALRLSKLTRIMTSSWWGNSDNSTSAKYCEQGLVESDARVNDWIKLSTTSSTDTAETKYYYFNTKTFMVTWTQPLEFRETFQRSISDQNYGVHHASSVESSCFLRRLSACRQTVLEECALKNCSNILMMRPDLAIASSTTQGLIYNLTRFFRKHPKEKAILARLRCVSRYFVPRTKVFPASLCHGTREEYTPCPRGKFTLDDQMAFIPASLATSYFREVFLTPPQDRFASFACPFTASWPEGRLTHTLLSSNVPVKELRGFRTIVSSSSHLLAEDELVDF